MMNISEIYGFKGDLITTTLLQTYTSIQTPVKTNRYLYLQDLEWLRNTSKTDFMFNIQLLRHPKIKLIARSDSHAKFIENYCNRKIVGIVDDFNLNQLISILGK